MSIRTSMFYPTKDGLELYITYSVNQELKAGIEIEAIKSTSGKNDISEIFSESAISDIESRIVKSINGDRLDSETDIFCF